MTRGDRSHPTVDGQILVQTIMSRNRVSDLRELLNATRALRSSLEATPGTSG